MRGGIGVEAGVEAEAEAEIDVKGMNRMALGEEEGQEEDVEDGSETLSDSPEQGENEEHEEELDMDDSQDREFARGEQLWRQKRAREGVGLESAGDNGLVDAEQDVEAGALGGKEGVDYDDIPEDIVPPSIKLRGIKVLDNPSRLLSPLRFEVTIECVEERGLKEDLRWQVIWVGPTRRLGQGEGQNQDQELDDFLVGPVKGGISRFIIDVPPPDPAKIPDVDILGATVVLLMCSYREKRFLQIGFYVNVCENVEEAFEDTGKSPPANLTSAATDANGKTEVKPFGSIPANGYWRNILENEPRVSQFPIMWDEPIEVVLDKRISEFENKTGNPGEKVNDLAAMTRMLYNDSVFGGPGGFGGNEKVEDLFAKAAANAPAMET